MSKEINLKIDQALLDEIKDITQNKYPLRKISSYAEATREALIDYVKKNQRYKSKEDNNKKIANTNMEA